MIQRGGEAVDVVFVDEHLLDDAGNLDVPGGDDRLAAGHRFDQHVREAFGVAIAIVPAGETEHVAGVVDRLECRAAELAEERDLRFEAQLLDHRGHVDFGVGAAIAADDPHFDVAAVELLDGLQQDLVAFLLDEERDDQDHQFAFGSIVVEVDRVSHNLDAAGIHTDSGHGEPPDCVR